MKDDFVPFGSKADRDAQRAYVPPAQPIAAQQAPQDDFVPFASTGLQEYTLGEIPLAAVRNFPRSAGQFYGGIIEAVTSPIDTLTAMLDIGAGALRSATPKNVRGLIDQLDKDPAAANRATDAAKAAGAFYADSYGSVSKIKRALAEDPVGVAADFSTIMSGGAMAAARSPQLAAGLQRAADFTNPAMPLTQAVQGRVPGTERTIPEIVGKGVASVTDLFSGDAGKTLARNIAREALGTDNVPRAQQMATSRFDGMTTGEAAIAADIFSPELQALQRITNERNPQASGLRQRQAESDRQGLLQAVTPDETTARAFRAEATDPYFESARSQVMNVSPDLRSSLKGLPNNIINEARKIARLDPEGAGQLNLAGDAIDGRTIGYISAAIRDELAKPQATTTTGRTQRNMLGKRLEVITREMESQIPDFQAGRQVFSELSPEVNQAQVLGEMQRRLTGPMDQERPGQFMRVLGEGEGAMLRTSTGYPRFQEGDLMRILSEEQGQAVTRVADQLGRQGEMRTQAVEGMQAMRRILEENDAIPLRAPNVLNRTIMVFNRVMRALSGKVSKTTMSQLDQAMRSGQDFNALLNSVPASERSALIRVINNFGKDLSPDKLRNIGLMGTLAEEVDDPFKAELRGMAQ